MPPSELRPLTMTPFLPSVLHPMIIIYLNVTPILEIFWETGKVEYLQDGYRIGGAFLSKGLRF